MTSKFMNGELAAPEHHARGEDKRRHAVGQVESVPGDPSFQLSI